MTPEIIEIGALKVNRYGEVLDVFNKFIQPVSGEPVGHSLVNQSSSESATLKVPKSLSHFFLLF